MSYDWPVPKFKPSTNSKEQGSFSDSLSEALKKALDSDLECQFCQNYYVKLVTSMRETTAKYFKDYSKNQEFKNVIKEYVVKGWGGINTVNATELNEDPECSDPKIITSQTKVYAAKNPSNFFVYDSSVSWALNKIALSFSKKLGNNSICFPIFYGWGDINFAKAEKLTGNKQVKDKKFCSTLTGERYFQYCKLLIKVAEKLEAELHLEKKLDPQLIEIGLFVYGRYLRKQAKLFVKYKK